MDIDHLDHFVLAVADVETTLAFYERVLGMRRLRFGEGRVALGFGPHKINVKPHRAGMADDPLEARAPTPGAADFCLITRQPLDTVLAQLRAQQVAVEAGPVQRSGARGPLRSVYFRDPDGNLIEVANELPAKDAAA